jgi:hypothetical protein
MVQSLIRRTLEAYQYITVGYETVTSDPDFVGFITDLQPVMDDGAIGQVLVESHADKIVTRYLVTITDATCILGGDGEDYAPTRLDALKTQQWVKVWFSGPVAESDPGQVGAQQIVVYDPH